MLRVIREVQPRWVVGENVFGLINWNDGLVFDEVQADLEAEGYEVQPYVLPAVAVNAPHRRDRVWFVAFKNSNKYGWRSEFWKKESSERKQWDIGSRNNEQLFTDNGKIRTTTNTSSIRFDNGGDNWKERHLSGNEWITQKSQSERNGRERRVGKTCETTPNSNGSRWQKLDTSTKSSGSLNDCGFAMYTNCTGEQGQHVGCTGQREFDRPNSRIEHIGFQNFPTQSPICGGDDGLPTELDGISFPKWRAESIKAYGNAVVPQVVIQIFKAIEQYENL
jgi:DNA (cytosine-5)-methyltransferase 1